MAKGRAGMAKVSDSTGGLDIKIGLILKVQSIISWVKWTLHGPLVYPNG